MINLIKKYKFAIGIVSILLLLFLFRHFIIIHKDFFEIIFKAFTVIIACLALSTWKKNLNFKKEVEVLDNLFNQCEKYISQHGYPNTESLYEIILNIKKEKIYFNANLFKDLENFINKLMEYHKILIQQKITKKNDIDFDKLITLPNEIRDLAICIQNIVLEKKYKLYDINFM